MTLFIRLTRVPPDSKGDVLKRTIEIVGATGSVAESTFDVAADDLSTLPGAPFAYWLSSDLRSRIGSSIPFSGDGRTALQGLITGDDSRFVRLWWEVTLTHLGPDSQWIPFTKGGERSPLYADVTTVVRYDRAGQVGIATVGRYGRGATHYYRPGLSWPLRGVRFSAYAVPAGCIFSVGGKMAFARNAQLLTFLALFNSAAFNAFLMVRAGKVGGVQYEAGLIQQAPIPALDSPECSGLHALAESGWRLLYRADSVHETSHAFIVPRMCQQRVGISEYSDVWTEITRIESEIDRLAFVAYGLTDQDRIELESSVSQLANVADDDRNTADEDEVDALENSSVSDDQAMVLSWLVGVAFGRFDPRLMTSERAVPPEPEPFDQLPARSPGMWPEGQEPADRTEIIVDDEGNTRDLVALMRNVADNVDCDLRPDLRRWLARELFPLHIRMYSKSRRKAPIYWQLATPSASYSVWLYIHAFTRDTLFRVQNDYVAPKLAHEERKLESMLRERDKATAHERKQLAQQEAFVEELRAFLDEVKRVAPLWNPDLDDGVIINFATLWRLVPQHKPWQKELKATWDALCRGEYDWSHLAMNFWPERVVPKCATDRSFAIAHGLEEVFWVEGSDGKWTARTTPARPVEELVRERTSSAVKAALRGLLDAPAAAGTGRKTKKGKANA